MLQLMVFQTIEGYFLEKQMRERMNSYAGTGSYKKIKVQHIFIFFFKVLEYVIIFAFGFFN